jgi:imidazolonepropionase-like amidohydrolase
MRLASWLGLCAVAVFATVPPAAAATLAFVGGTVIDGTGKPAMADAVVIAKDGTVTAVGPRASTPIPADAQRIDVSGKTLIPGLINAHGHVLFRANATATPHDQLADQLALYARYGVTTVYSLGDDEIESVKLRDELRKSPVDSRPGMARLYVAGPVLNAKDVAEGRAVVTENAKRGVDIIKIRLEGPPDAPIRQPAVYGAMIAQAHADNLRIAVHMFTAAETKGVVDAGGDVLAHSVRDRDVDAALIAAIKAKGVSYIPTLTRDLAVFVYESTPDFASDSFFTKEAAYRAPMAGLMAPEAQAKVKASANAQSTKAALAQGKRNLKLLSDAGVLIAMGTDTGAATGRWQGYFEHVELAMMVESGLTPMQALVSATGGAARAMKIDDTVGTLQVGRRADLLVLTASPLTDIKNTRKLEQVWIGGRKAN